MSAKLSLNRFRLEAGEVIARLRAGRFDAPKSGRARGKGWRRRPAVRLPDEMRIRRG